MPDFDFSPFWRSSVGFDRMFNALQNALQVPEEAHNWPPYNIRKTGEDAYRIELAVAGFTQDQLSITAQQNVLIVNGKETPREGEYLYQGIASGPFERRFSLADFIKVVGASFSNGILCIDLVREVPEAMKPRKITIGGAVPQQIEQKVA
jgi:molecular chaperone IbpA